MRKICALRFGCVSTDFILWFFQQLLGIFSGDCDVSWVVCTFVALLNGVVWTNKRSLKMEWRRDQRRPKRRSRKRKLRIFTTPLICALIATGPIKRSQCFSQCHSYPTIFQAFLRSTKRALDSKLALLFFPSSRLGGCVRMSIDGSILK